MVATRAALVPAPAPAEPAPSRASQRLLLQRTRARATTTTTTTTKTTRKTTTKARVVWRVGVLLLLLGFLLGWFQLLLLVLSLSLAGGVFHTALSSSFLHRVVGGLVACWCRYLVGWLVGVTSSQLLPGPGYERAPLGLHSLSLFLSRPLSSPLLVFSCPPSRPLMGEQ